MADNAVDLSRRVKDTEMDITDLEADDPIRHKTTIESLKGLYNQLIEKLRDYGINYRSRL
jgi:hypothetical protein